MSPKTADLLTKYQREPMKEVNFRRTMTGERGWLVNKHREPWTVPVAGENHQPQYKKIRIAADRNLRV